MREIRPPGSVRGVFSNGHSYRDMYSGALTVTEGTILKKLRSMEKSSPIQSFDFWAKGRLVGLPVL